MELFTKTEITTRREKLFEKMEDFSVAVIFGGVAKKTSADAVYPFIVNRNFYYLTQIDQEDSILVLYKTPATKEAYLFIQPYDETKEKWTGKLLTVNEAKETSYIDNVLMIDAFDPKLDMLINEIKSINNGNCNVYLDLDEESKIAPSTTTREFKENIQNGYDNVNVFDIYDLIVDLRMVKSFEEIERLKKAVAITKLGILKILENIKPGLYEYQLVADFEHTLKHEANTIISFDTIAASGKNATILHYPTPNDILHDGDMILFDLGAQYDKYCGDISRTFPINGKYSDIQLKVYNAVLQANELVLRTAAPGVTIAELQAITKKSLAKSCMDLGLIEKEEDINKYYFHNVSHHIGLDTHDPSFRDRPLEPGNVISDEPGLYIKELGIGVRIEDDVLITQSGCMCLSASIAKQPEEIEKLLASRG